MHHKPTSNRIGRIELENKLVLAIAIRLKAEELIIEKLNDPETVSSIGKHQTMKLIKAFNNEFSGEEEFIALLEQVRLITPEHIHINSFMYEPILDMSRKALEDLYTELKNVNCE